MKSEEEDIELLARAIMVEAREEAEQLHAEAKEKAQFTLNAIKQIKNTDSYELYGYSLGAVSVGQVLRIVQNPRFSLRVTRFTCVRDCDFAIAFTKIWARY